MPDNPTPPRTRYPRLDHIEDELARIAEQQARAASRPERLAYRSSEIPALVGISKATFHGLLARGIGPPAIKTGSGHMTLYVADTLADWLRRSEVAGKLLERAEYVRLVEEDAAAEAAAHERRSKRFPVAS